MRRTFIAFALAATALPVVFATSTPSAQASPLELFGFGGRSPALAGAGVADAEDFASVYLNPAGLAAVTRKRLTLGTALAGFRLRIDSDRERVDPATALVFGGTVPIPLGGALADRIVLGLGFHIPNRALVRVDRPVVAEPTFVLLDNRADSVAVQVALGFRVSDKLDVGAGVLVLAALAGKITVENDAAGAFVSSSEQRLVTNVAPVVGGRYVLSPDLSLGLTLRGPSRSDYDIEVEANLTSIPLGLPEIAVAGNAQYDPGMIAVGVAYSARRDIKLLGDLEYRRWSAFPRPTENPVIGNPPPPSPGFRDTVVPKLGIEATTMLGAFRVRARGGYALLISPAPEMDGEASLLDNHRHLISSGVGVEWHLGGVPMHVDGWGQIHQLHGRRHEKVETDQVIDSGGRLFAAGITVGAEL